LGRCARATITKDRCILTGFPCAAEDVTKQVAYLFQQAASEQDSGKREAYERRIARLTTGIVTIKVGASSDTELRQKKARIEDSLLATRCALDQGIVPGGGMTYIRAMRNAGLPREYQGLFEAVACVPLESLRESSGDMRAISLVNQTQGINFATGEIGDMIEMGIIDPAKVVKAAIRNSFSAAATLAACDHIVVPEQPR
jgi:chaperonin GroEL